MSPRIVSLGVAVPPHKVSQVSLRELARNHFSLGMKDLARLISVFDNVQVKQRHFCVSLDWFTDPHTFEDRNSLYNQWAEDLAADAILRCLGNLDINPSSVDHLIFVSTSGFSTPSIDARLINRLGFDSHVSRTPIFGLGCAGGAAGLARSYQLARSYPNELVLLVAVEISSLTFQPGDFSKSNLVASALFSDGAGAVLVAGSDRIQDGPEIIDVQSTIWPKTLELMGWKFSSQGMEVIFSKSIPFVLRKLLRQNVKEFLDCNRISLSSIGHFSVHPGGAKILESISKSLNINENKLEDSRIILERYGNMSSPTVLFILKRLLDAKKASEGDLGLVAAFGPGFSAELLLLRW